MMDRFLKIVFIVVLSAGCNQKPSGPDGGGNNTGRNAPAISGIAPERGEAGSQVIIYGSNFSETVAENTVMFGRTEAMVSTAASDSLVAKIPDGLSAGSVTAEVTTGGKTATGPDFAVQAPFTPYYYDGV